MGLAVSHLTALELAPVQFIAAAARAGFDAVGLRAHPAAPGTVSYALEPGLEACLHDHGMRVQDVEFVPLTAGIDLATLEPLLEGAARLEARSLSVSGDDTDVGRLTATFAALCEMAQPYGLRVELEFMRWRPVASLADALRVVEGAGQDNAGILLDALHLFRSGGSVADVEAAPARWLRAVQLCDAPLIAPPEALIIAEARGGRLAPGAGQLPLQALLQALPGDVQVSVELPCPGLSADERLALAWRSVQPLL